MNEEINELLVEEETRPEFEETKGVLVNSLDEQWSWVILSGVLFWVYKLLGNYFGRGTVSKRKRTELENRVQKEIASKMSWLQNIWMLSKLLTTFYLGVANRTGQAELDRAFQKVWLQFNLTSKLYKDKIASRVATVLRWANDYTSKYLARKLVDGIIKGKTQREISEELLQLGQKVARSRWDAIMMTETTALIEYMRHEIAVRNWVTKKRRIATMDERTCPICWEIHDAVVDIDRNFPWLGIAYPPVHTRCRCYLEYMRTDSMWANYILWDTNKAYTFYDTKNQDITFKFVNPEAIWVGGKVVWRDKILRDIYDILISEDSYKQARTELISSWWIARGIDEYAEVLNKLPNKVLKTWLEAKTNLYSKLSLEEANKLSGLSTWKFVWVWARTVLTDVWFLQLIRKMGFRSHVPKKYFT